MAATAAIEECQAGGEPAEGEDGAEGYVFFGETQEIFIMAHFFTDNADPEVVETTADLRNRDPCGDVLSYMGAVDTNLANVASIDVPTLVVIGAEDAIYPVPASEQAALLTGSDDVTEVTIPQTGHAVTLHRNADGFQATTAQWLTDHGFGPAMVMPVGGVETGGADRSAVSAYPGAA
jgi:pimeloyl-ACP methyl ester carboxylesterase